jgi:TP901 family phage tail tape measure protein
MSDRTVVVRLVAMVGQYQAALGQATASTNALRASTRSASTAASAATSSMAASQKSALGTLATTIRSMKTMMLGIGVPLSLVAIGKSFFDFEQKMAHVRAVADTFGRTSLGMKMLSDAALEMGQKFGFSATEVAEAQEALLKAGRNTAQVLGGDLHAALTLAAAGTISLDEAAKITSITMTVFRDEFKKTGMTADGVADQLVGAANVTVSGVSEMGAAMSYVAPLAASLGVSFKDTVAAISLFNQAGIDGERAGTNLRGMLTNLLSPSAMARAEMVHLGINLFDAQGKFIGVGNAAQMLQDKIATLKGPEMADAIGKLTTNASMPGFIVLMNGGKAAVDRMEKAIENAASAQQVAAEKLDSVTGAFSKLGAAIGAASIQAGAHFAPAMTWLAKSLTGAANAFGDMGGAAQLAMVALGAQLLLARRVRTTFQQMGGSIKESGEAYRLLALGGTSSAQSPSGVPVVPRGFIGPLLPIAPGMEGKLRDTANQARGLSGALARLRGDWQAAATGATRFAAVAGAGMRGVQGAAGGLLSVLGGSFGVALMAATAGLMIWQANVAETKRVGDSFKAGLAQLGLEYATLGQVSEERVRSLFNENKEMSWLIANAKRLGLSIDTISQAAAGQRDAFNEAVAKMEAYRKKVQVVRDLVEADKARRNEGSLARGDLSKESLAGLASIGVSPKAGDFFHTESQATQDRLHVIIQNAEKAEEAFKEAHKNELIMAQAAEDLAKTHLEDALHRIGSSAEEASTGILNMASNLEVMDATQSSFSDRINAMAANVDALTTSFFNVTNAMSAFYSASQEGIEGAFSEKVPESERPKTTTSTTVGADGEKKTTVTTTRGGKTTTTVTTTPPPARTTIERESTQTTGGDTTAARTVSTKPPKTASTSTVLPKPQVTTTFSATGEKKVVTVTTDRYGRQTTTTVTTPPPSHTTRETSSAGESTVLGGSATRRIAPVIDEITGQFDVTTAAGRKQNDAMVAMASASSKAVVATFEQVALAGKKGPQAMELAATAATAAFMQQREQAVKAMKAVGMTDKAARALVDTYYAMPSQVATYINAKGVDRTISALGRVGDKVVALPQGKIAIISNTRQEADRLRGLGGQVTTLKDGRFKVTFENQDALKKALDALVARLTTPLPAPKIPAPVFTGSATALEHMMDEKRSITLTPQLGAIGPIPHASITLDPHLGTVPSVPDKGLGLNPYLKNQPPKIPDQDITVHVHAKPAPSAVPFFQAPSWGMPVPVRRWGAVHSYAGGGIHATVGKGDLIRWAEPATGGEAYIPRLGDVNRSERILATAASWYGMGVYRMARGDVVNAGRASVAAALGSGSRLTSARGAHVTITVRGEGHLAGMIEATVDGHLVKVARAVSHSRTH